jgi:TRAP-type C4-dicarboxylate transport system permease small subunit
MRIDPLNPNLFSFTNLGQLLSVLLQAAIIFGGIFFFIFLIIGGLQWVTSGGDKEAVASARNKITSGLVGLIILVGAFAVIKIVETLFGVCIISGCEVPRPTS